jgi:16S rRNA (guanine527-N7)-methyltransferase
MSVDTSRLDAGLAQGLAAIGLAENAEQHDKLLQYLLLLNKWNQSYNLTGIRKVEDMLSLNLLDSLVLHPYVLAKGPGAGQLADVGTGAGLPGLPLAIVLPNWHFTLIDSNSKKTRFIFQALVELEIDNVSVVHARVEDYAIQTQVDIVTSRAFSSLADFVLSCRHLLAPAGKFLAMKGQYPAQEIAELPEAYQVEHVHRLQVPGVDAERHLVEITVKK